MFTIQTQTNSSEWENFITQIPEANFLQSWNWGVFHQRLGKDVFFVSVKENEQIVGVALAVKEPARRGAYLAIAGGPLFLERYQSQTSAWQALITHLKELAQAHHCVFIRVRPQLLDTSQHLQLFQELGFVQAPMHLTADLTLQLDLTQSEEELLAQMRKNTRYEVKKAEKLGIEIRKTQDPAAIDTFYQHQLYLAEKHGFVPFSKEFLKTQFEVFAASDQAILFDSYLDGMLLASAFIIFYNGEAVYHYGTSTPDNAKLPGSYACQWAAIQEAKNRGCTRYNFWGIAPEDQPNHRFAGVSLFKRGFGGAEVAYLPALDLATSSAYLATKLFEWGRKKVRRLG